MEKREDTAIVLVSKTMKENYIRFGDMLCFDLTYKLLKKKINVDKHIGVGFFVGMDTNLRIVLFGVAVLRKEDSLSFAFLFESLF